MLRRLWNRHLSRLGRWLRVGGDDAVSRARHNGRRRPVLETLEERLAPAAGDLDTAFNPTTGIVTANFGAFQDVARAVAIQDDGKIVVAGSTYNGTDLDVALIRYNSDGTPDADFNGDSDSDGKIVTPIGSSDQEAFGVAIQPDGKIVVVGYTIATNEDFLILRYNSDGTLDTTEFGGGDGIVTTDFGSGSDRAFALALQDDGAIVVAGRASNGATDDFAVARYLSNGDPDSSFNSVGRVTTSFGTNQEAFGVAIQSDDGAIVAAGYTRTGSDRDIAIARFTSGGALDESFNSTGKRTTAIGSGADEANAVIIQADGKIVVAGYTETATDTDFALVRYTSTGGIDGSFGASGSVTTSIGTANDKALALALQDNGKLVAAGFATFSTQDLAVVRYTDSGIPDASFGASGKVTTAIQSGKDVAYAIALQGDGNIVVAGEAEASNADFVVARYLGFPAPTTSVSLDGTNNLVIADTASKADTLTIQFNGTHFIISDPNNTISTSISGASGSGTNTVTIPLGLIAGVVINGGDESDSLTVDLSSGAFTVPIEYNGENPTSSSGDQLVLTGGSFGTITHTFTGANSGSVAFTGGTTGNSATITYSGLEPVTDNNDADNREFTFTGGAETITLTDAAGANMTIDSTLGESVTFPNPTSSLTINAGDGDDTVTITSVDADVPFEASLTINGDADSDSVNLNSSITFASGNNLSVTAESIAVGASTVLTTSGAGTITLSGDNIAIDTSSASLISAVEVILKPQTIGQVIAIDLGGNDSPGATLGLTNAELTRVTAATLRIGSSDSGAITVSADISRPTSVLSLESGGSITASSGADINVAGTTGKLALRAGGQITLDQGNSVGDLAATTTSGGITYVESNAVSINTVDGLSTVSTTNAPISISTSNGTISVTGSATVNAGNSTVLLSAGTTTTASSITGQVIGTGGVTIVANSLIISTSSDIRIDAGTSTATLRPATADRAINLGTATGALDLTNAELDRVTAGTIVIGSDGSATYPGVATGTVTVADAISHAGDTDIVVVTARDIAFSSGSSWSTSAGDLTFVANQQTTPTAANFVGIVVNNATLSTTGSGNISLTGTGGASTSDSNFGVRVTAGGQLNSSAGGKIDVHGTGGGTGTSSSNLGVLFDVTGVAITSSSGDVTVTGQGGTNAEAGQNYGVYLVNGGTVESTGSARIDIDGTGGGTGGSSGQNYGVLILGGNGVRSSGGDISITGQGGAGGVAGDSFAVGVVLGASITASNTAGVTVIADSINIDAPNNSQIDAGSNIVTLLPKTAGTQIDLGGADADGSPKTLGLTDAELDCITAGTLIIGNSDTGNITVTAAIDLTVTETVTNLVLRTGGSILDGTGTEQADLIVANLGLIATGGVGGSAAGDDLNFNVATLTTDTTAGNADQFLFEEDSLTIADGALDAGNGSITLTGGTFFTTSSGGSILSTVNVNGGATLAGNGTTAAVNVNSGTISPGAGPGIINTGNLDYSAGGTLTIEINGGTTAGTDYDQVKVTGTVTLGAGVAILDLVGGYTPTGYDELVIINNDDTDPIDGYFMNFPEGSIVTVGGFSGVITYKGGTDSNDVVLRTGTTVFLDNGDLIIRDINGAFDDDLTVSLFNDGTDFVRVHDSTNVIVAGTDAIQVDSNTVDVPLASITGNIQVDTRAGSDSLTVDYLGGDPLPAGGLDYTAGDNSGDNDTLEVTGYLDGKVEVTHTGPDSGTVQVVTSLFSSTVISFSETEPLTLSGTADDLIINLPTSSDDATLEDSGIGGLSQLRQTNGTFEITIFTNPAKSLTINGGDGDDNITIDALPDFDASLTISGDGHTDSITLSASITLGSATAAGNVVFDADTIKLNAASLATDGDVGGGDAGSVTFNGSVLLGADIDIDAEGASSGNDVTFNGTVNGTQSLTISAGDGNVLFGSTVGNNDALVSVTINSAEDVTFSLAVTTTSDLTQSAGTGTTTFNGAVIGGALNITTDAIALNTATVQATGAVSLSAQNAVDVNANLDAGSSTIFIAANQDGADAEGFTQAVGTTIQTGNTSALAVQITVNTAGGGTGDASLALVQTGTGGTVTIDVNAGAIIDNNDTTVAVNNIDAGSLVTNSGGDTGAETNPLETTIDNLTATTDTGGIFVANTGALTVLGATGDGKAIISAASPETIAGDVIMGDDVILTAGEIDDDPVCEDNLTVQSGVTVQSNNANVFLNAGDDIIIESSASVIANLTIELTAGFNNLDICGAIDLDGSLNAGTDVALCAFESVTVGSITANGTVSIFSETGEILDGNGTTLNIDAAAVAFAAETGIGVGDAIETDVANLEAESETGGIFISNTGDLAIGGVTPDACVGPLTGVRVTGASGAIDIDNDGTLSILISGEAVSGPDAIDLFATLDILTGGNQDAVASTNGTVTLEADRDLLLGDSTNDRYGDIEGGGSVILSAGRDILVDEDTFVDAHGAGTLDVTAVGAISLLQTTSSGARFGSEGGTIILRAGGAFSANADGAGVNSTFAGAGGGDITICADSVTLDDPVNAGNATVRLTAKSNISASAVITADALGARSTAGAIDLDNVANQIATTFAAQTLSAGASVDFRNGNGFATGEVSAFDCFDTTVTGVTTNGGRVELCADAGDITVGTTSIAGSGIDAGSGLVMIQADTGGVTQTVEGTIEGGTLVVRADANVTLCAADNDVDQIAVNIISATALIEFHDVDDLTVSSFTNTLTGVCFTADVAGLVSANNDINLNVGTSLTLNQVVNAGTGDVRIVAGTTVTQIAAGVLTADELGIRAGGAVTLCAAANDVNTLAISAGGLIEFHDADDLVIGTVLAGGDCGFDTNTAGLVSTNNDINLNVGTSLTLNQVVNAGTGDVRIVAGTTVTQIAAGTITADELGIRAGGAVTLCAAANDVNTLAISTTGPIEFHDADDLVIGTVLAGGDCGFDTNTAGLVSTNNDINLNVGTSLTLNQVVNAGTGDVRIVAGTTVTQIAAGTITADELGIRAGGAVTLCAAANDVNTLAISTTGLIEFHDADDLVIGTVLAGGDCGFTDTTGLVSTNNDINLNVGTSLTLNQAVNAGTGDVRIVAGTTVTQIAAGTITADELGIDATDEVNLCDADNDVAILAIRAGGSVEYRDASGFSVGTVAAGGNCGFTGATGVVTDDEDITLHAAGGAITIDQAVDAGSGDVRLQATGNITASAVITGNALGVNSGGNIDLDNPAHDINVFAAKAAGTITFANQGGYAIGTVLANDCFTEDVSGVSGNGDITLCADSGDLDVDAPINAGTFIVRLHAEDGNVAGTATITANALGVSAPNGNIFLDNVANAIASHIALNAGATSATAAFRNATGFAIGQVTAADCFNTTVTGVTASGLIVLCADSGTITVGTSLVANSGIHGGTTAAIFIEATVGGVTQTVEGTILGASLGVRAGSDVTLCAADNDVNRLAVNITPGAGLIEFRDVDDLIIASLTISDDARCFTGTVVGLDSNGGNINLGVAVTSGGLLDVQAAIDATGTSASGDVRIVSTLANPSGVAVSQTASGPIFADELGIRTADDVTLCAATNDVNVLAVNSSGPAILVEFQDADDLIVGQVSAGGNCGFTTAATGIDTNGGNVNLLAAASAAGVLDIQQPIDARGGATGDIRLVSATANPGGGAVTQNVSGDIFADELGIRTADDVTLCLGQNDVRVLAVNSSGPAILVEYSDESGFTIGTIAAGGDCGFTGATGIDTNGGDVNLRSSASTGGVLNFLAPIDTTGSTTGDVRIVSVTANAGGVGVTQDSNGDILADELGVRSSDDVVLCEGDNDVNVLSVVSTGPAILIEFSDLNALTIGAVSAGGGCGYTGGNGIDSGGGNVNLRTGAGLTLDAPLNAGAGDVRIRAAGTVSQVDATDIISADELGIISTAAVDLDQAANDVNRLAVRAANAIDFLDADDLIISAVAAGGNCGFTGATGVVSNTSGNVTVTTRDAVTAGQNLTVATNVQTTSGNILLRAGDNFTLDSGATINAIGNVEIRGDFNSADSGVGSTIEIAGTITNTGTATVLGELDPDTINLRRKGTGSITLDGQGSGDIHFVQLGNLQGIVNVADTGAFGADLLQIDGTASAETIRVSSASVTTTKPETVNYSGIEDLRIFSLGGSDVFNVVSTHATATTLVDGGASDDAFNVSSDAPTNNGDLEGIAGPLTVEAGSGTANRLVVSDFAGAGNADVTFSSSQIVGLAPAPITYRATGGNFTVPGGDGIVVRGSDEGDDTFTIASTLLDSTTRIEGLGGADTFRNDGATDDNGDLDVIVGRLTLIGGDPGPFESIDCDEDPIGTRDVLFLNDRGDGEPRNYIVGPNGIFPSDLREFIGVIYDDTMDYVRLDGTDEVNVFDVSPSLTTQFYIDGNLPPPGECLPGGGDFLRLNTAGTTGRRLHIDAPGEGHWSFTSGHEDVCFESIERFNHVDILAVANAKGAPIVRVYDAETFELKFVVNAAPYFGSTFVGGVRVATGDLNSDGLPDLVAASGPGPTTKAVIYNGSPNAVGAYPAGVLTAFNLFTPQFKWGAFVSVGDVNGDGCNDLVVGADMGWLPQVRVYDGDKVLNNGLSTVARLQRAPFLAYPNYFRGGVRVATGDITGDGAAEIVVGSGPGTGTTAMLGGTIKVFNGFSLRLIRSYRPFGNVYRNGVFVSVGDVNGDGVRDVIAGADVGWLPMVRVFDGATPRQISQFLAFANTVRTGARVVAKPVGGGDPGSVEKVTIMVSSGPLGGLASRKVRQALAPTAVIDRLFESATFNGIYLG